MGLDCWFVKLCEPGETAPLVGLPENNRFCGLSYFRGSFYNDVLTLVTTNPGLYSSHRFNANDLTRLYNDLDKITLNMYFKFYDNQNGFKQIQDLKEMIKAYKEAGYVMECSW